MEVVTSTFTVIERVSRCHIAARLSYYRISLVLTAWPLLGSSVLHLPTVLHQQPAVYTHKAVSYTHLTLPTSSTV